MTVCTPEGRSFFERQQRRRREAQARLTGRPLGPRTQLAPGVVLIEAESIGAEPVEAEPVQVEQEIWIAVTPRPQLQVISGPDQGRAFDLGPGELTVGREAGSDIQLGDHSVSHIHALLRVREGRVSIEDLRSTNGTWVNRTRIERQTPLADGDRIDVGREQLLFVQEPGQS